MQLYTTTKFVYFKKLKRCNKTLKSIIPMKKILLLVFVSILSISAFAAYENPNPYAYDLSASPVDNENFKVTLQYSLNAPATSVKIFCQDEEGNSYLLKQFGNRNAGTYTVEIDLFDAMENKNVPPGEDLSWWVEVACASRGNVTTVPCGKKINFRSPYSIDIDNNPKSPYFGRIVTTQANSNETRGLRAYKPNFTQIGSNYIGSIVRFPSGNWYDNTHLTPFRIRVLQDGTGRIFVSSADVGQSTYMWQVNPANLNDWSVFLTSAQMIALTKHAEDDDTMANHNFDFRKNANGQWELLLLSSSVNSKSKNCSSGFSYCGVYTLNSDLSKNSYTQYIENRQGAPHKYIDDWFVASVLTGNAQFDPNGNILYSSYQQNDDPEESALIHQQRSNNAFAFEYNAFERLKRKNTSNGGIRYSADFSKLAVGCGNDANEVSICNTSHSNGYLTISSLNKVDMITSSHNGAYIIDFAWDYASNLYACVRNSDDATVRGVWVMAYNLEGQPVTTPARDNFSIPCDPEKSCTVTCQATEGGRIVNGFSGGTQKACTQMTVKAEPVDNNYKFDKWTDQSGKTVSTNAEYTFRVVKDVQLTAHFSGAVFNVTWWNLFQNREDIAKASGTTPDSNERLWRLYQVFFNQYCVNNSVSTRKDKAWVGDDNTERLKYKEFDVAGYLTNRNDANANYLKATAALRSNETTDATTPFVWLRKYIEYINNGVAIKEATSNASLGNRWGYALYCFFNTTNTARNYQANDATYMIGLESGHKSFVTYGKPENWRTWWTEGACDLPRTYNYSTPMPTSWKQINVTCQDYSITTDAACPSSYKIEDVPITSWYKWNTPPDGKKFGESAYLLAWREGSTNGRIVHQVDRDMALYATYLNKHISESQDNYDVIRLMQNSKYASNPHTVAVDRKLQAGMYNTICFPFPLDVTTLPSGHRLKDAEVLKFTGIEELYDESGEVVGVLQFERVTQLEAGKPYLIKVNGQNNITEKMYFEKVAHNKLTYVGDTLSAGEGLITFHAIISPEDIPAGSIILVSDNRLAKVTTQGQMLGLRGYFTIDDPYVQSLADEGKLYLSIKKPTTTSIPVAPEAEQQKAPKVRKIMQDGHIYIIRGEEVYTVTGHRVK